MSSRLALGDNAESSPTDLTAATNIDMNDARKALQEALTSPQYPVWAKQRLRETRSEEQWGFAPYTDHSDMREKLFKQDRLFGDELDEEELRLVDIPQVRTLTLARAQHK